MRIYTRARRTHVQIDNGRFVRTFADFFISISDLCKRFGPTIDGTHTRPDAVADAFVAAGTRGLEGFPRGGHTRRFRKNGRQRRT